MVAALVSVDLFKITTFKHVAAPKQEAAQDNAALLEILISKPPAGQVLIAEVAPLVAPQVNVVLFKTQTDKPTVAPRLAEAKASVDSSATTTSRLCAAL